ncbi:MAG: hypothetical protein RIG26_01185 [Thalassospira sp.]|uniref:hypothetical protein n=1 Tax=Thalassospira sp. TaxID=1912094 RepID=UPI0032EE0B9F
MFKRTLIILAIVFCASVTINHFFGDNVAINIVALFPASGALLAAIWLCYRDYLKHEGTKELQDRQSFFALGATSHIANTVFDKHVMFCEAYLSEVHQSFVTLFRKGPTDNILENAWKLREIRTEYAAWLTRSIETRLEPFEQALRTIGANSGLVESLGQGLRDGTHDTDEAKKMHEELRLKAIKEMYDIFLKLMDLDKEEESPDEQATIASVMQEVRNILQVNEFVEIRYALVRRARNELS